jgi:multicomponent Na+:H+ antiporter subunit B
MQFSNISESQNPRILKDYILDNAYLETGAENSVTSVYLYYRYYDTLFEALMLLFSIIAVIYMSIHGGDKYDE